MQDYHDFLDEVLIDEARLRQRVAELGKEIARDYAGLRLVLICILRGGVVFLSDLMRQIAVPHTIDFMAVASYDVGVRRSSGEVRIALDLKSSIEGRHVLLVEDIVDTGHTISNVIELLHTRRPASIKVCTLLDKSSRREVKVPLDYIGFDIPDKFVFGYGLDIDEYYRELPFVGTVDLNALRLPLDADDA